MLFAYGSYRPLSFLVACLKFHSIFVHSFATSQGNLGHIGTSQKYRSLQENFPLSQEPTLISQYAKGRLNCPPV